MKDRDFYLAAYDISQPRRLRRALHLVRPHAIGGQKSVFECFLTTAESEALLAQLEATVDASEDTFMLLRLDPRARVITLGRATAPSAPGLFYHG